MSDHTRDRINAAFDSELTAAPVPPSLRHLSMRAAMSAPRLRSRRRALLALVAAVLVIALTASLVIGSHVLRSTPLPAKPTGSTVPPAPLASAASTYDEAHGVLVIYGGSVGHLPPDTTTWTWDGKYWVHLHPPVSPPGRQGAVMAYDRARHEVVLFGGKEAQKITGKGGCCAYVPVDDTWTWNGTTWRQRHPQQEPPLGFDFAPSMAYDPVSKTVLLFGFTQTHTEAMTDKQLQTWAWNGSEWKQLSPVTMPPSPAPMVTGRDGVVLLEEASVGGRYITQMWGWDGSNWMVLSSKFNPPSLGLVSVAYDSARQQVVALSGDTWTWDGATWKREHNTVQPLRPGYMAYMASLHEVVSWGNRTSGDDNEMSAWNGTDWVVLEPRTVQAPRVFAAVVRVTPDQAASTVRSLVKNTHPVLLPTFLPSGGPWDALLQVTPDDFTITYETDQRDKTITICICGANPPPGTGPSAKSARVRFRNSAALKFGTPGYADYFVYDTTDPVSQRWLMWLEPGSATNNMVYNGGVEYYLSAGGLTDVEFWQIANSLQ